MRLLEETFVLLRQWRAAVAPVPAEAIFDSQILRIVEGETLALLHNSGWPQTLDPQNWHAHCPQGPIQNPLRRLGSAIPTKEK